MWMALVHFLAAVAAAAAPVTLCCWTNFNIAVVEPSILPSVDINGLWKRALNFILF